MQSLESFAKVGAVTAAGAFFGALTLTTFPVTFDDWKHVLAPALGAAIAAEFAYLRSQAPAIRDAVLAEVRGLSPQLATLLVQAFQAAKPALPAPDTTTVTTAVATTTTQPAGTVVE